MLRTLNEVVEAAKRPEPCTIAVAAAQDLDVLTAVYAAVNQGLVRPLLVGDKTEILRIAGEASIPVSPDDIVDEPDKAFMQAAALSVPPHSMRRKLHQGRLLLP